MSVLDASRVVGRKMAAVVLGWGVLVSSLAFVTPTAKAQPHPYVVDFSTFFGGSLFEQTRDAVTDPCGNLYVTGGTQSTDFPTTSGANDTTHNGWMDVFVAKFNRRGNLVWSTFLGGPNYDRAYAIELDAQGYVYVGGRAGDGFPTTPGVLQPTFAGDTNPGAYGTQDGFVAKLTPDGSQVVWATYFGGPGSDFERDIDVDDAGNVYLAVAGLNQDSPHITPGAFDTVRNGMDGGIARIAPDATGVVFFSYVGGSADDGGGPTIRMDWDGNAYLLEATPADDAPVSPGAVQPARAGGSDMLLTKFNATGAFLWGTYFGGSGGEGTETHHLAIDPYGNPVMAAYTSSTDLPTNATAIQPAYGGNGDAFIARISADGSTLLGATYLGGTLGDGPEGTTIDAAGDIYVSGATGSPDFPTTPNAFQTAPGGGGEMFGVKVSLNLTGLQYATYVGGSGDDSARSSTIWQDRAFILVGQSASSTTFPLVNPHQGLYGGGTGDNVIVAFSLSNAPPIADAGPNQAVPKNTLVTLDATGCSDPEGDCLAFAWTQVAGPPVSLAGATTATPTFTPTVPGLYTFELVVDDGAANATDSVDVTVTGLSPSAVLAVNPTNVALGAPAEVTANGSSDADGTIVAYNFTFGDGTWSVGPASWTTHAWSSVGAYDVNVTVTDDDGFTDTATTTVSVTLTGNEPPVAAVDANPAAGDLSTVFQLDGSDSSDPDGAIVNWSWDLGDGQIAYGPVVVHRYATRGTFLVSLTVRDDDAAIDMASTSVDVLNRPPISDAGPDGSAAKNGMCVLNGSSSSDPDGDALSFAWQQVAGPGVTLAGPSSPLAAFVPRASGTYTFELRVADSFGGEASDFATISVANAPPMITAAAPSADEVQRTVGDALVLAIDAVDPDGDALSYAWFVDGAPAGNDAPYYEYTSASPGGCTIRVDVSDGEATTSRAWTVTVEEPSRPAEVFPWWIVVVILAVVLVLFLWWRRRREARGPTEVPREKPPT